MSGIFENYSVAILDSSLYMDKFPEELISALKKIPVCVADTFMYEIEGYRAILPKPQLSYLDKNLKTLYRTTQLKYISQELIESKCPDLFNDIWGLINVLKSNKSSFVLLTSNKLLIERIAASDYEVDIYDLNSNTLVRSFELWFYKKKYALNNISDWIPSFEYNRETYEKQILYRKDAPPITLGKRFNSGMEANLHFVSKESKLIAKIFKDNRLYPSKFQNIKRLQEINSALNISWAAFPIDILYFDKNCTIPAGFTENYIKTKTSLAEIKLYLGELEGIFSDPQIEFIRISSTIDLCMKIVSQISYLNNLGFLVCDFNKGNFSIRDDKSDFLQMWDTDSFGYESFFSGYCAGDHTSREYDISKKSDAIGFCCEAMYLLIFHILSLGDAPISEFTQKFKYNNTQYFAQYRKAFFPENLWQLFADVFNEKKSPSLPMLMQQLQLASYALKSSPSTNRTYKQIIGDIFTELKKASPDSAIPTSFYPFSLDTDTEKTNISNQAHAPKMVTSNSLFSDLSVVDMDYVLSEINNE